LCIASSVAFGKFQLVCRLLDTACHGHFKIWNSSITCVLPTWSNVTLARRKNWKTVKVDASGNFVRNSADPVYKAALAGLGIADYQSISYPRISKQADLYVYFPNILKSAQMLQ
jgi:hypothetical protein